MAQVGRLDGDAVAVRVVVEVLSRRLDHRFADLQADVIVGRSKAGNERQERLTAGTSHVDDGGAGLHEAPAHLEGHHPHRIVLGDATLEHVVKDRSHFLIKLPGSAGNDFITLGFTHARVADVNAADV